VLDDDAWALLQEMLEDSATKVSRDAKTGLVTVHASSQELKNNEALAQVAKAVNAEAMYGISVSETVQSKNQGTIDLNTSMTTAMNLVSNPSPTDTRRQRALPEQGFSGIVVIHPGIDEIVGKTGASKSTLFHELSEMLHRSLDSMSYSKAHLTAIQEEMRWRQQRPEARSLPLGYKAVIRSEAWKRWLKNHR
jgi:hypothetical protein